MNERFSTVTEEDFLIALESIARLAAQVDRLTAIVGKLMDRTFEATE